MKCPKCKADIPIYLESAKCPSCGYLFGVKKLVECEGLEK